MREQHFEAKNEQIKERFRELKKKSPEKFKSRLNLSWSNWGFGRESLLDSALRLERAKLSFIELHGNHYGPDLGYKVDETLKILGDHGLGVSGVCGMGGGLGVAYLNDQKPPAIVDYVDAVVSTVHSELGPDKRLLLEPGRALVANSAVTLYTVQTVKRNVSTWVAVDGGMSDNLRPMLYGSRYEAVVADRVLADANQQCRLAGKHCESGDVIVRDVSLADPSPGDVIATPVTGAYGYSLANNYNGVPRPPVIFCRDGDARVVVRRETYEDLAGRDVG